MKFNIGDDVSEYFQIKNNERYFIAEFKENAEEIDINENSLAYKLDGAGSYKKPKYGGFLNYSGDKNILIEVLEESKEIRYILLNKEELFNYK